MAKIQTYGAATSPLSLSDMLIGTEVNGPIPNATKNFSLGDLLNLFSSSLSPLTTKGDLYTYSTINTRIGVGSNGQILSADSTSPTGLSWINPPATSPLTTKGDLYTFDTTNTRLSIGANGQLLSVDTTTATGLKWVNAPTSSPLTTKGDLYSFSTTNTRLAVGINGQILSADSTSETGLKWINAPSGTSPLTTKGDIYVFGTTNTRLPIGTDSQVLVADSTQPTGLRWTNSPAGTGYYAQYFSYYSQFATTNNVGKAMYFETVDMSNGVTVVSDGSAPTKITFANAGKYNLQFSTQFQNGDNAQHDIYIWLRKNGTTSAADVVGSTGLVSVPARKAAGAGNEGHVITGWNFLLDITAGDFYQIVWATSNITNVTIQFYASTTDHPSTASTLFTVTQPGGGTSSGGSGTPAAPNGSVQFNNSGSFGGDSNFSWDNTNKRLGIGTSSPQVPLDIAGGAGPRLLVYGSTGTPQYLAGVGVNMGTASNSQGFFVGQNSSFSIDQANVFENFPYPNGLTSRFVVAPGGNVGIATTNPQYTLEVDGTVGFPSLTSSSNSYVLGYNVSTGEINYQLAGGGGGGGRLGISLPVPTVILNRGTVGIQALDRVTGGALDTLTLHKYPTVIASDLTNELFSTYQIFLEMVHFKRKGNKHTSTGGYAKRSGYVVEPDLSFDGSGNRLWPVPWPANFFTRNQSPCRAPAVYSENVMVPVTINRPNWATIDTINQNVPVWQYLNSRFYGESIEYRDQDGNIDYLNTYIPVYGNRAYYKNTVGNGNRFAYSTWYNSLYVAFRYIAWDELANGERGQIISGPLSRVVRVSHRDFPFRYDFNASSIHGVPCAGISDKYIENQLQCFFETRLP